MTQFELLKLLAHGRFRSGQSLAEDLGRSRSAIWKAVRELEGMGLDVHAVRGRGYRLAEPLELLEQAAIARGLTPEVAARLEGLEVLPQVDSTNSHLMRRIAEGQARPQLCFAEYQQSGRGRRGRSWLSPLGRNLCFSLLWPIRRSLDAMEGLSLVVAVALVRALNELGVSGIGIKWPNDLYWQQRKLAGILIELNGEANGNANLVIGIGLNVAMAGPQAEAIDQPWTDVSSAAGRAISRNTLAAVLSNHLIEVLERFEQDGLAGFIDEWRRHDLVSGREFDLLLHDRRLRVRGLGIDPSGALLVEGEEGRQRFLSGEVSLRLTP